VKELFASLLALASLLYVLMVVLHMYGVVESVLIAWFVAVVPISILFALLAFDGLRAQEEIFRRYT